MTREGKSHDDAFLQGSSVGTRLPHRPGVVSGLVRRHARRGRSGRPQHPRAVRRAGGRRRRSAGHRRGGHGRGLHQPRARSQHGRPFSVSRPDGGHRLRQVRHRRHRRRGRSRVRESHGPEPARHPCSGYHRGERRCEGREPPCPHRGRARHASRFGIVHGRVRVHERYRARAGLDGRGETGLRRQHRGVQPLHRRSDRRHLCCARRVQARRGERHRRVRRGGQLRRQRRRGRQPPVRRAAGQHRGGRLR